MSEEKSEKSVPTESKRADVGEHASGRSASCVDTVQKADGDTKVADTKTADTGSDDSAPDTAGLPETAPEKAIAFSRVTDPDTGEVNTLRVDTESLPLTEAFDVDNEPSGVMPLHTSAEDMSPDAYTGAVPIVTDGAVVEAAKPVRVPGEIRFLKRWALVLVLLAVWIPSALVGLLLYQHWFDSLLPHDRLVSVTYVLIWVFACIVVALLLAMVEPRPLVVALAFAVLTAPAISVAAAGAKYGYVACTAPDFPNVQSACPEPLHGWGKRLR